MRRWLCWSVLGIAGCEEQSATAPHLDCAAERSVVSPPIGVFLVAEGEDPLGQTLRYDWSTLEAPEGALAEHLNPWGALPVLEAPIDLGGSYVFEVIASAEDGRSSDPCLVELTAIPSEELRVELTWTEAGDDLDLHLIAPGGGLDHPVLDCHYTNCIHPEQPDWGIAGDPSDDPQLLFDDIEGLGAETIRIQRAAGGSYTIIAEDHAAPGSRIRRNLATIDIYLGNILAWTETIDVRGEATAHAIAEISFPEHEVTPL